MNAQSVLKSLDFRAGDGLFSLRLNLIDGRKSPIFGTFYPLSKTLQLPKSQIREIRYLDFTGPERAVSWVMCIEFLDTFGESLGMMG